MWRLYLRSDKGIAIQSTVERLQGAFETQPDHRIFFGEVRYLDYEQDEFDDNVMSTKSSSHSSTSAVASNTSASFVG